jgi:hypothetical protein
LSHHDKKAYILVKYKSLSGFCSQEVTAYFTLVSVANCLTARCLLMGPYSQLVSTVVGKYDMIYLLTAIVLSPGGSTHLHTNNT